VLTSAEHIADKREGNIPGNNRPEAFVDDAVALTCPKLEQDNATSKAEVGQENDEWYGDFYPAAVVDGPCAEHL
jgi:hypothetical protein